MIFRRGQFVRLTAGGRRSGEWSGLRDAVGVVLADRRSSGPIVRWIDRTGATIIPVSGCPVGVVEPAP